MIQSAFHYYYWSHIMLSYGGCHSTCHTDLVHVLFVANGHVQMELLPGKKRNFSHIWSDAVRMELGRNLIHKYSSEERKNTATTATADHTEWVYWTNTLCHSAKNRKTIYSVVSIILYSCIILFTCCLGTLYQHVLSHSAPVDWSMWNSYGQHLHNRHNHSHQNSIWRRKKMFFCVWKEKYTNQATTPRDKVNSEYSYIRHARNLK